MTDLLADLNNETKCEKITIHWARHAESCANYSSNNYMDYDFYPDRPKGYDRMTAAELVKLKRTEPSILQRLHPNALEKAFRYHPNLSYVGIQQAILLGVNFIHARRPTETAYDVVYVSASLRTIMTALFALRGTKNRIIVAPYVIEHINLAGPYDRVNAPVSTAKLEVYVSFIKDWLEKNWIDSFDDIEVMRLLRIIEKYSKQLGLKSIIMKNIGRIISCGLRKKNLETKCSVPIISRITELIDIIKQIIKPKLSDMVTELESFYKSQVLRDNDPVGASANSGVKAPSEPYPKEDMKTIMQQIRDLADDILTLEKIRQATDLLTQLINPSVIRGPDVDFSIIKKYDNTPDFNKIDMNKFYHRILIPFINSKPDQTHFKILCVVHGTTMRSFFHQKYPDLGEPDAGLKNTQVFEEVVRFNKVLRRQTEHINYQKYVPQLVRSTYENFEFANPNICGLNSVQGVLYNAIDNQDVSKMSDPTPDVVFYLENAKK